MSDAAATIARLLRRADDVRKAAPARSDPARVREQLAATLTEARRELDGVGDGDLRLELAGAIARRVADLDALEVATLLGPSPEVRVAPTTVDDAGRIPPGQHLTAGFPVLHVERAPDWTAPDVRVVVTGLVEQRTVLDLAALQALGTVTLTRDFHCVTTWSRLGNAWTGVPVRDVLARAGVRGTASHAVVAGYPAYTTNLSLEDLTADDVLLAWAHDQRPLAREHGGPLRLVVPHL